MKLKILGYSVVGLLITFSSFEYFFRGWQLIICLYIVVIVVAFLTQKSRVHNEAIVYIFVSIILCSIQCLAISRYKITSVISLSLTLFGSYYIAKLLNKNYILTFINIISFIAFYSLVIYLLSFYPTIKAFLFNLASNIKSINADEAVVTGGGVNFVIYNFQQDISTYAIGIPRNCGPFWEPGMFAVFLSIALFFNLFVKPVKKKFCNLILSIALITTFSTGGYFAGSYILILYGFNKKINPLFKILLLVIIGVIVYYVSQLEFVVEKTTTQYNVATYGSDKSRFGAFLTQINMIGASPLIGGEDITEYATTKTLASGTLLPFVNFGIPLGFVFYLLLYKSCNWISNFYQHSKKIGLQFFILLIILSFSQTILLSATIYTFLFIGIVLKNIQNGINSSI